jgi:hypothetical protein
MSLRTAGPWAVLAVFLGGSWAAAQDRAVQRHSGGSREQSSNNSRSGNGGGEARYRPPTGAQLRHPRAGTGTGYGSYRYAPYRSYYGGYRSHRGGYPYRGYSGYRYRGYYGYPYRSYGYSSPYYYASPWYSPYLWSGWASPYLSIGPGYQGYAPYGYADHGYDGGGYGTYGEADDEGDPSDAVPPAESGRVVLEVRPAEAAVYVDDEFRGAGRSRHTLQLGPGPHRLEVVHPRFRVFTRELSVEPGDRMSVVVELDRN